MVMLSNVQDWRGLKSLSKLRRVYFILDFMIIFSIPAAIIDTLLKILFVDVETWSKLRSSCIESTLSVRYHCSIPVYIIRYLIFAFCFDNLHLSPVHDVVGTKTVKVNVYFSLVYNIYSFIFEWLRQSFVWRYQKLLHFQWKIALHLFAPSTDEKYAWLYHWKCSFKW